MFQFFSSTLKEFIISFENKYYSQIDGAIMGSPLGSTFLNIYLCYHQNNWFKGCPKDFKQVYYKKC